MLYKHAIDTAQKCQMNEIIIKVTEQNFTSQYNNGERYT